VVRGGTSSFRSRSAHRRGTARLSSAFLVELTDSSTDAAPCATQGRRQCWVVPQKPRRRPPSKRSARAGVSRGPSDLYGSAGRGPEVLIPGVARGDSSQSGCRDASGGMAAPGAFSRSNMPERAMRYETEILCVSHAKNAVCGGHVSCDISFVTTTFSAVVVATSICGSL